MKYVSDTHSLFWFQTDDFRLGKKAKEIFERAEKWQDTIIIPSIILLELIRILEKNKQRARFEEIIKGIEDSSNYEIFPLELDIIKEVYNIKTIEELHDRVIIATTKLSNCKLITKDEKIIKSELVECVW